MRTDALAQEAQDVSSHSYIDKRAGKQRSGCSWPALAAQEDSSPPSLSSEVPGEGGESKVASDRHVEMFISALTAEGALGSCACGETVM